MFEQLETLNPDPILGLMALYRQDQNPKKIDLGVGVYRDETGATPIMAAVTEAESIRQEALQANQDQAQGAIQDESDYPK